MNKYHRPTDGHTAVLYSPGQGTGWSTDEEPEYRDFLMFDPGLVQMCLDGKSTDDVYDFLKERFPLHRFFLNGWKDITIKWLRPGTPFTITCFEGAETIIASPDWQGQNMTQQIWKFPISPEDAMCLWEAILDTKSDIPDLAEYFETKGTAEVRMEVLNLVDTLSAAYLLATDNDYDECFDWDFCPWFVMNCIDFSTPLSVKPDWKDRVMSLTSEHESIAEREMNTATETFKLAQVQYAEAVHRYLKVEVPS
jgi:hypothetical protein